MSEKTKIVKKSTTPRKETTPAKPSKEAPVKATAEASKKAPVDSKKAPGDSKVAVESSKTPVLCLVRVRGAHGMRRNILDTLKLLSLHSVNHAVVVPATESISGMINKVKDYIAYGQIDADTMTLLMKKRGLIVGNLPLTDEHVQSNTDFKSINDLAKAIVNAKVKVREIRGLKPVFRLHPPKGGHRGSIKKSIQAGGVLGNHGDKINIMLRKMI